MALSFTRSTATTNIATGSVTTITSASLSFTTNDLIVAVYAIGDNSQGGTLSIANSGSALSWNVIAITNTGSNTKVAAWWALAPDAVSRTVSVTGTVTTGASRVLHCLVHTGAHQTTPVPAGNVFSGANGTDVSQAITPTASGSMLWMMAADWSQTNSFAGIANCTLENVYDDSGQQTAALIRPTTQPRTDALSFTIGETDTAGTIAWVAFEVHGGIPTLSAAGATSITSTTATPQVTITI